MTSNTNNTTYTQIRTTLLQTHAHKFHSAPSSPNGPILPSTSPTIASLSLHPVLESILHLLNQDLSSAHFLLRHAQAAPAWESMYAHGILHRIEGDVDNARAWYGDVQGSDVFGAVWGSQKGVEWKEFLGRVERWRDRVRGRNGKEGKGEVDWEREERELGQISLWELERVLEFCEKKFGTGEVVDARSEYTMLGEKHGDIAAQMITGGEGWREF